MAQRRWSQSSEIRWLAIDPRHRGVGLGTSLLNRVLDELAADGVRLVEVTTLDRSCDYTPYVATRAFWERRGFVQVDVIDPYPGWEVGNPCAIYVASLEQAELRRSR